MLKRILSLTVSSLVLAVTFISLSGCSNGENEGNNNTEILRILNCEDYIYEADSSTVEDGYSELDLMDQFVEYMKETYDRDIEYVYDTFDTNETMYNEISTGKTTYDLVVPSDYMIQKMIVNDLLEPYDESFLNDKENNVGKYMSPYLKTVFSGISAVNSVTNETVTLDKYAIPYMWGTVGIVYNPEYSSYVNQGLSIDDVINDFSSWDVMYDERYGNSLFIKDSVRDTYAVSIIHVYKDEINALKAQVEAGTLSSDDYNKKLTEIFNRCDDETLKLVQEDMLALKANSFGFEVDSGKNDVVTGKVAGNLAWSGDAVYSLDEAESEDLGEDAKELYYSIPQEGSNIWFDGLVMIKSNQLNKDLAQEFINFLYDPAIAEQNMYYVGYTPGCAGEQILNYVYDCYDLRGEIGGEVGEEAYVEYDIRYFFEGTIENTDDALLYVDESQLNRQLRAQYPEQSDLVNLAIMNDFGTQNSAVIDMWEIVRNNALPTWAVIVLSVELGIGACAAGFLIYRKVKKTKREKAHRAKRAES